VLSVIRWGATDVGAVGAGVAGQPESPHQACPGTRAARAHQRRGASLHSLLAAQVFAGLPESDQPDIAERIARIGEVSPDIIRQVEEGFRRKLSSVIQDDFSAPGGIEGLVVARSDDEIIL
jgi:FliG middle domain